MVPEDLKLAVRHFGRHLDYVSSSDPGRVLASAVGCVAYDDSEDEFYYGVSGIPIDTNLVVEAAIQRIRTVLAPETGSLNPPIDPEDCAEVQALRWALNDDADPMNLHFWTL